MRIRKPGTDHVLDITVNVNHQPATEYVLPSSTNSDGYIDTYIAVSPSQRLTVKTVFSGSILHGQFDLVADGTFCKQNTIEGDSVAGNVKHVKRSIKWETGYDVPIPPGWTSIEHPTSTFEGELLVGDLNGEVKEVDGGKRPGVGSLVLVASANQLTTQNYHDREASLVMGSWKDRMAKGEKVRQAKIPPEYALQLRFLRDEKISGKRATIHKNKFNATRYGSKPWGKFCFYYRSLEAIQQAGGTVRGDHKVLEVEKWGGPGEFIAAQPTKKNSTKKKKNAEATADNSDGETLFVQQGTPERIIKQEDQSDLSSIRCTTPKPKKKKGKLGGSLFNNSPKKDVLSAATNVNDEMEVDDAHVQPTEPELGVVQDDDNNTDQPDQPDPASGSSNNRFNYFDQQESETSESIPVDDTALVAHNWNLPSSTSIPPDEILLDSLSPRQKAKSASSTPSKSIHSFAATLPSKLLPNSTNITTTTTSDTANMDEVSPDSIKLSTEIEIRNAISADGTIFSDIDELFNDGKPYGDLANARRLFNDKVKSIANLRDDGKFYLRRAEDESDDEDGALAVAMSAPSPKLATATGTKPKTKPKVKPKPRAASPTRNNTTASSPTSTTRNKTTASSPTSKPKPKSKPAPLSLQDPPPYSPTAREFKKESSRLATSPPPQRTSALKRKDPSSPAPSTPMSDKRPRTTSATPGASSNSAARERKQRLATLKRELAAKQARTEELLKQTADKKAAQNREEAELIAKGKAEDERYAEAVRQARELDDEGEEDGEGGAEDSVVESEEEQELEGRGE